MELKIEKLVYGGDGLARLPGDERGPGKTVFVPFVLEDELVEVLPIEQKPGFTRAQLERVVQPSPLRVEPPCPYFQNCGGCHYQHTGYQHQLEMKASILRETLKRTAKMDLQCQLQIHSAGPWNYRNRTRLKVQSEPGFSLGYYKHRSHELLPVRECPISSPLINQAIRALMASGHEDKVAALREVEFFADSGDTSLLLEAYCELGTSATEAQTVADFLRSALPEVRGVIAFEQSAKQLSEPRQVAAAGEPDLRYEAAGYSFRVSAGSFFQVNRFLIDQLASIVSGGASGALAVDLYAGVGLFSVCLARSFAQVIAVEPSQTSYRDLRHNAPQEVKAVRATTEQYLAKVSGIRPDLVVADPPRGGLGENVIRNLAKLDSPRITYVSCDPSTLARDLRILQTSGYHIREAHLVDLFPQTYHLESVFHLAR